MILWRRLHLQQTCQCVPLIINWKSCLFLQVDDLMAQKRALAEYLGVFQAASVIAHTSCWSHTRPFIWIMTNNLDFKSLAWIFGLEIFFFCLLLFVIFLFITWLNCLRLTIQFHFYSYLLFIFLFKTMPQSTAPLNRVIFVLVVN